jgi:hypothetical protein
MHGSEKRREVTKMKKITAKGILRPAQRSNIYNKSRDSSVGIARGRSSSPGTGKIFLSKSSRPVLGPTQPPFQWVPGGLFPRE